MKHLFLILVFIAAFFLTAKEVIRDKTGKIVATATEQGNRTVYRDKTGKIVGTAVTNSNGKTVYRDSTGKIRNTKQTK